MSIRRQDGPNFKEPKAERGTKAGLEHMRRIKQLPCVICLAPPPSDAHHCISGRHGQKKRGDFETIPLCKKHHQFGPDSIHQAKKSWQEKYGLDTDYLETARRWLAEKQ